VTSIVGDFDDVLPSLPPLQYDLIFIDGNHRGAALIRYVNELAPCLSEKGVIVCDDIHWSRDMEAAWDELIQENRWTYVLTSMNGDSSRQIQAWHENSTAFVSKYFQELKG
jgi:predicted O-methyltransferase YrrM